VHHLARGEGRKRALLQVDQVVVALEAPGGAPVLGRPERLRQVLHEASPERQVHHLHAAADAEERHIAGNGIAHEGELPCVAHGVRCLGLGMRRLAIERRLEIIAAGEHEGVDSVEHLARAA